MPWTSSDANKHKKGLSKSDQKKWAEIANSVLKQCLDNGGKQSECEAKAIRIANSKVNNNSIYMDKYIRITNNYQIRHEEHNGKQHIILPVTLMVDGVHAGSHGPLLHSIEELGRFPASWNGIPITINHPKDDEGNDISANDPDVIDREAVGRIFNTHVEGDKLKGEAWIDIFRVKQVSPTVLQYIESKQPVNVSVGVFTDEEEITGQWKGESYQAIAHNHRPDHLAILPSTQAACSLTDGCGLGVNENKKGGTNEMTKRKRENLAVSNYQLVINTLKYSGTESGDWSAPDLEDFDVSSSQWDELDKSEKTKVASHFIIGDANVENFSDLHYPVVNSSTGKLNENALRAVISGRGAALKGVPDDTKSAARRRAYRLLNEEFDAELDIPEDLEAMKNKLESNNYVVYKKGGNMTKKEKVAKIINNNKDFSDKDRQSLEAMDDKYLDKLMPEDGDKPCCPEKVDALINNESTKFTKEDRDKLLQLDEATLDKMIPQKPTRERKDDPQNNEDKEKELKEQIQKVFSQYQDSEKFIEEMIPGGNLKDTLKSSLNVYKEQRKNMIEEIKNHNSKWTDDDLNALNDDLLKKVHESVVPEQTNYAAFGGSELETNSADQEDGYNMVPETLMAQVSNNNGQEK